MFSYMCLFTGGIHVPSSFRGYPWSQVPFGGITCDTHPTSGHTHALDIPPQTYSPLTPWTYSPRRTHPTGTPSTDIYWWPPKRAVRILLECFLVHFVCDLFVY